MSITNEARGNSPKPNIEKPMGYCPYCQEKPAKKMQNKKKDGKYSVLQKCRNGHIWRSLYADG